MMSGNNDAALNQTPLWLWLPAAGTALLLHAALLGWLNPTDAPQPPAAAKGDGDFGLDIGLGIAASQTQIMARLAPPPKPPVPVTHSDSHQRPQVEPTARATLPAIAPRQSESIKTEPAQSEPEQAEAVAKTVQPPAQKTETNAEAVSQTAVSASSGSNNDNAAGGVTGSMDGYLPVLMRALARHKEYPPRARNQRQQGVVQLAFAIDRRGNLLSHELHQSSGYPLLDRAALTMLRNASPLPALPDDVYPGKGRIDLILPFEYSLIGQ